MRLFHKIKLIKKLADVKCIYGPYHFSKEGKEEGYMTEQTFLIKDIIKVIPVNYNSFFKNKLDYKIEEDLRNYNIYKCTLIEPTFLEAINSEINRIMILTKDELFNKKIYHYEIIYYKALGINLLSLSYFFLHLGITKDMPITINTVIFSSL